MFTLLFESLFTLIYLRLQVTDFLIKQWKKILIVFVFWMIVIFIKIVVVEGPIKSTFCGLPQYIFQSKKGVGFIIKNTAHLLYNNP